MFREMLLFLALVPEEACSRNVPRRAVPGTVPIMLLYLAIFGANRKEMGCKFFFCMIRSLQKQTSRD